MTIHTNTAMDQVAVIVDATKSKRNALLNILHLFWQVFGPAAFLSL